MRALVRLIAWAILGLGAVLPAAGPLPAPPGVWAFRAVGMKETQSIPAVTAITQDTDGFLWVGTEDGLYRLEGEQFRRFGLEQGLPASGIRENGLSPGLPRGLWIKTAKGLVFWNGTRFHTKFDLGRHTEGSFYSSTIATGGAAFSQAKGDLRFFGFGEEPFREATLPAAETWITAATHSAKHDLLVLAFSRVVWIRHKDAWRKLDLRSRFHDEISALLVDRRGGLWLRSPETLLHMDTVEAAPQAVATPVKLTSVNAVALAEDATGRIWTNTAHGLVWFAEGRTGFLTEANGLPKGGAQILYADHQGTLWVGGDGVHKLVNQGFWTGWGTSQGIPADIVWSICRTQDGRVWAGTSGGLAVDGPRGWETLPGTRGKQFMAMAEDPGGRLWMGTNRSKSEPHTLYLRLPGSQGIKPIAATATLDSPSVQSIVFQGEDLWLGTEGGLWKGHWREAETARFTRVPLPGEAPDLPVHTLAVDPAGGLWVGTKAGLFRLDEQGWKKASPDPEVKDPDIACIATMADGTAWVSNSLRPLLTRYRVGEGGLHPVESFRPPHALCASLISSLAVDASGVLWLGTPRGVLRWDGRRVERYDRNTGLPGDDCSQNGLWLDPNGDLWTGLSVGMARAQLTLRQGDQVPPAAVILHARDGRGSDLLVGPAPRQVPWGGRSLTFRYGPHGSVRTEALTYQVRLAGLEDDWRDTQVPEAHYAGLAAGHYQFLVRTVNSVGETGYAVGLDVRILAPWWQRAWFRILAGCALVVLAFGLMRWRTSLLRRRNAHLESLVKARTAELETANEALREASLVDPLTHLHNRRYLAATLPEEATRVQRVFQTYLDRHESPVGRNEDMILLLIDLDHFKQVNDTYGHHAGDQVLQQTAQALRSVSRSSDTLARWGGEEFLMVAKRSDRTRAALIADNLCEAVRSQSFALHDGRVLRCTCSVGFACFPFLDLSPEALTWEDTLQIADQCLYMAKEGGRNGWVGAFPGMGVQPAPADLRTDLEDLVKVGRVLLRRSVSEA